MRASIVLLRGVNVGRARRLPMAELRALLESLGCTKVRTLLNSGNAVFIPPRRSGRGLAAKIRAELERRFGWDTQVIVLSAAQFEGVVTAYPWQREALDSARTLVAFLTGASARQRALALLRQKWPPERMAFGRHAVFLSCPGGILDSPLLQAFSRAVGEDATTRNWATVLKLQAEAAR